MTRISVSQLAPPASGTLRRIGAGLRAAAGAIARERATRYAAARLARLDDRLLADIGLARDQIEAAVRHGRPRRR